MLQRKPKAGKGIKESWGIAGGLQVVRAIFPKKIEGGGSHVDI